MENIGLKGKVELNFYIDGKFDHKEVSNNLIVNSGYNALFSGLSGQLNKNIVKVQCGTNATQTDATDIQITDAVDLSISTFNVFDDRLEIEFTLGENDANGTTISEFGTICDDGTLFSRIIWNSFLKTNGITTNGIWTIYK